MAPIPPTSCSPGPKPKINDDLKKIKGKVTTLLNKVDSDIATTNVRVSNTVNENSFSSFSKKSFDNIGGIPNAEKTFLFGQNGKPIVPENIIYEVDENALYGSGWGNIRPPGMHPKGRYASKVGENVRLLNEILPTVITDLEGTDREAFISFVTYIQEHESGGRMGQAIVIGGGYDIRPTENKTYDESVIVHVDEGPFPRTNPVAKGTEITSPYRQTIKYRGDYGCWQYLPPTWLGLMKRYKRDLLQKNPDYKFCWLAPPELEVELQLRNLYDAWKGIPIRTPYLIKATMLYMYNFLPVTYNYLKQQIILLNDASQAWTAYLRFYEAKVVAAEETSVSLNPLNNLAYLKSIAASYRKMKANPLIAKLETYSVPEDPGPLFDKYNKGK